MSSFVEPRDREELEGTLLPVAHAVPAPPTTAHDLHNESVPLVATATPVSYFAYDDNETSPNQSQAVQDAPAVPLAPPVMTADDAQLRTQLAMGQRAGAADNDAQIEDIARGNRRVHALNYFTTLQVQAANRRAQELSRAENVVGWEGPKHDLSAAAAKKAERDKDKKESPSTQGGTFGKEYQVGEYEIKEYDTNDYEISEYKSIYDN